MGYIVISTKPFAPVTTGFDLWQTFQGASRFNSNHIRSERPMASTERLAISWRSTGRADFFYSACISPSVRVTGMPLLLLDQRLRIYRIYMVLFEATHNDVSDVKPSRRPTGRAVILVIERTLF